MDFDSDDVSRFSLVTGDVLVCEGGEVGRAAIWTGQLDECYFQKALHRIRTSEALNPHFLRYLLEHYACTKMFAQYTSGTTISHLPQEDLRNLAVPIPPASEQARIVAAIEEQLSRLDTGVAGLERVRHKLRQLRNAIVVSAVSGDWPSAELGEVASVDSGPAFQSQFFQTGGEGIRLLRGDNIEPGRLRWVNERTWPMEMIGGYEHLAVAESDLILAMDRPIISTGLKLASVRRSDLPALLVQRVARIRAGKSVLTAFLHLALQQPSFISHLLAGQTGTQLPHITLRGIRSFTIPLPRIEGQSRIVANVGRQLSQLDGLSREADLALRRSRSLRRSILSAAFSGRLTTQNSDDERAQALLERIAADRASSQGDKPTKSRSPGRRRVTA